MVTGSTTAGMERHLTLISLRGIEITYARCHVRTRDGIA